MQKFLPKIISIGILLSSAFSCKLEQRAAVKLVHPELQRDGIHYEGKRVNRQLHIGPYEVTEIDIKENGSDDEIRLALGEGQRPGWSYLFNLKLRGLQQRVWLIDCIAHRRSPKDADYAAALDENRDEINMQCEIAGTNQWKFTLQGKLSHNLMGTLQPAEGDQVATLQVEVLLWRSVWRYFRRHLPTPLVQGKQGQETIAAMTLARPQQLWLAKDIEAPTQEALVAVFVALQMLPAGWEG